MCSHIFVKSFAFIVGLLLLSSPIAASHHQELKHLTEVKLLLENLSDNGTGHVPGAVDIKWSNDSKTSNCYTDSHGLVNALLSHSYGFSSSYFHQWLGNEWPVAKDYYHAIISGNRFENVKHVTEVKPGDIMAIVNPSGEGIDSGHIAIVNKLHGWVLQKAPYIEGTQQWSIGVIDCAAFGHGNKDSRYSGHGSYESGLGSGVIRVYIDPDGVILGHTWSRMEDSEYFSQENRPLAIGHLIQ